MSRYTNIFSKIPEVKAVFSTKEDGSLSFKWQAPQVVENRQKFFNTLGLDLEQLIMAEQTHTNLVKIVNSKFIGRGAKGKNWINKIDGLVTNDNNVIIGAEASDCGIIFAVDPVKRIIGIAHAGWRGVVGGMVNSFIQKMKLAGAEIDNIKIETAPHIQKCCFEIKPDVLSKFLNYPESILKNNKLIKVDLRKIIKLQLLEKGIKSKNIKLSKVCTCCNKNYFSWRRDKQNCSGGMIGVIKLK